MSLSGATRGSFRKSTRQSNRSQGGADTERLQVVVDGVDRTPKPLLSLNPTVLKGVQNDTTTPNSESSEFFMDRMSTAAFTKAGWYSNADSGSHTPKSENDYPDYESEKRDRERKAAEDAALAASYGDEGGSGEPIRGLSREEDHQLPAPALLNERDLERSVYLTLHETETIFIWQAAGVTVAMDTEEAKAVEEANRRYANLLHTKQATDKYVDAEAQTLVALTKSRDVQSAVLVTRNTGMQATAWDISDTFRALDEAAADADDDPRGGAVGTSLPSISQMAGGVAKYNPKQGTGDVSARGTTANAGGPGRTSMFTGGTSYMSGQGTQASGHMSGLSANLPNGVPVEQAAPSPEPADPLRALASLPDALMLMDNAINQNNYLQQLLLYRDIQPLPGIRSNVANVMRGAVSGGGSPGDDADSDVLSHTGGASGRDTRPLSAAPSDGGRSHHSENTAARSGPHIQARTSNQPGQLSRQPSERSIPMSRGMSLRDGHSGGDGRTARNSHGGGGGGFNGPGYAASVAESNWPEELLQELADLGDDAPRMEHLWDWVCPMTTGKNVACMGWNKTNSDLLAVGYGSYSFPSGNTQPTAEGGISTEPKGLVAFWSLKNLQHPLWYFEVKAAVTALDFSTYSPNVLAIGLYDGTVAIYDIKSRQGTPSMESDVHSGKHSDPVWKVKWLDHGPERDEPLVSISTDGRVTQWSIAKGLEFSDLMKLKRMARRGAGGPPSTSAAAAAKDGGAKAAAAVPEQQDAFISRLTSGMAFDFSSRDERIYVAATEDGWLHKCSTSYSEQYLESYRGHMGPVYQVQFSPFKRDMFISASGDWTIRMWQEGRDTPLLTFQASTNEINDVQWCPTNSTVFGSVTASGRLEIWDFSLSTVKPVMHQKTTMKLSCLLFAPNYPVVVCGGEDGAVKAYRIFNVSHEYDTLQEQLERLDDCIRANVMKSQAAA
ncbi:hypothetical protein VOLCADRAFT_77807 [Volvox carteri f. nagariensis]|uniref:Dynein axonemal intermediate chain 4 n=1 Tax=Volvox carteri f. nagariensis TaxID=3068 RepID=D8UHI3_VOLCA|nr:uncharacterized protein VOLCADRAFT_77807 [Volvox carteri f. nagariensis]EFJ40856.1 hypothetical protein VOLCADRAFT_77807 [Volvox carteri f. nagariensis]|eukprot:XP_002958125.1 hypothetical protein VOLCADRAFT_77807 [Volvox carteri f. nagariensis]